MDAGDIGGLLGGTVFGAAALKTGEVLVRRWLAARAKKAQAAEQAQAQVAIRAVDADVTALQLLADRVRGLEAAQVMERRECDAKIESVRERHEECERRLAALDGEMKEVRRSIGHPRPDDTARHGLPLQRRTIKEE